MKKFVLQIILLFVILCIIALPIDYAITKGLRTLHSVEFAVWNDIYSGDNMDNDLVVLGASTAWTGYNTYMMDSLLGLSTYNLGIDGHPWYMYKVRYNTYASVAPKPQYIIINIDKATFLRALENPYMREQFLPYPKLMWQLRADKEFSLLELCLPYYRYLGYHELRDAGINAYLKGKPSCLSGEGCFYKGYWGQDKHWDEYNIDTMEITSRYEMACCVQVKEDIVNFIHERQNEGIDVVLCRYPIYRPYLEKCKNVEKFEALCEEICKETKVSFIDLSVMEISGDTTYYYNPTHLNIEGSAIFTKAFCDSFAEFKSHDMYR